MESGIGIIGKSGTDNTKISGNGGRVGGRYLSKLKSLLEGKSYIIHYITLIISIHEMAHMIKKYYAKVM